MLYFLAWLFPPLAVLLCGKPVQATLNLLLCCTIIFIPVAAIWACVTVAEHNAERRTKKLERTLKSAGRR